MPEFFEASLVGGIVQQQLQVDDEKAHVHVRSFLDVCNLLSEVRSRQMLEKEVDGSLIVGLLGVGSKASPPSMIRPGGQVFPS